MVVDTRNWWPGKKVIVSPEWIRDVNWSDRKVYVDVPRQAVKDSPDFDPAAPVDRAHEERLPRHYDRPTYWKCGWALCRQHALPATRRAATRHARLGDPVGGVRRGP